MNTPRHDNQNIMYKPKKNTYCCIGVAKRFLSHVFFVFALGWPKASRECKWCVYGLVIGVGRRKSLGSFACVMSVCILYLIAMRGLLVWTGNVILLQTMVYGWRGQSVLWIRKLNNQNKVGWVSIYQFGLAEATVMVNFDCGSLY